MLLSRLRIPTTTITLLWLRRSIAFQAIRTWSSTKQQPVDQNYSQKEELMRKTFQANTAWKVHSKSSRKYKSSKQRHNRQVAIPNVPGICIDFMAQSRLSTLVTAFRQQIYTCASDGRLLITKDNRLMRQFINKDNTKPRIDKYNIILSSSEDWNLAIWIGHNTTSTFDCCVIYQSFWLIRLGCWTLQLQTRSRTRQVRYRDILQRNLGHVNRTWHKTQHANSW